MNKPTLKESLTSELALERKREKNTKSWYIFYTSPRAEKVVYRDLLAREYEVFLPVIKSLRVWKNRQKKEIETPLFPSYIFVNTVKSEIYDITRTPKIATCVTCGQKPSVISSNEINSIRKVLSLEEEISVETSFGEGENVRIVCGPLKGHEGILVNQKGKSRFGIRLKAINHTVFINVCTTNLERLKPSN